MTEHMQSDYNRYRLRYAGGIYWLLDCEQEGMPYREPIPMNEVGAAIFEMMQSGRTTEEIVAYICEEYGAEEAVVQQDVAQFMEQLSKERHG